VGRCSYCKRVRDSKEWGRQMELRALADCLRVQILVHSAGVPALPMKADEAAAPTAEPVLNVSYHKHQYTLGEHYNSVVPASEATPQDEVAAVRCLPKRPPPC
jgi:OTU domain-containing protein 6